MPRKSRIDAPGAFHHIIARGIERSDIFKDNTDRNNFLNRLGGIIKETKESEGVRGTFLKYSNNSIGRSFGTLLDKLICRLNLERVLGRLSNQYFKARPIRPTTLPKYCFLGIKSFSYLFKYI